MPTLATDELERQPSLLLDDARQGTADIVAVHGEPMMLALPIGQGATAAAMGPAVARDERDPLSLGLAAKVAVVAKNLVERTLAVVGE